MLWVGVSVSARTGARKGLYQVFSRIGFFHLFGLNRTDRETFFNSVNAIRVMEFTILDLLRWRIVLCFFSSHVFLLFQKSIDESLHDLYGTYASSVLPKSIASRKFCFDSIKRVRRAKRLLRFFLTKQG